MPLKDKIKVLVVSTNSDEAGAPRHCESMIQELRSQIFFEFVSGQKGPVFDRLRADGIPTYHIKGMRSALNPFVDTICFFRLIFRIFLSKPDILHLHSAKAGLLGRLAGFFLGIPVVYSIHGFPWRGMSSWKRKLIKMIEWIFARLPNVSYILVSNEMRKCAQTTLGLSENQYKVIHNGVPDLKKIKKHSNVSRLKIIMPARVCEAKDHETLFKAVSKLRIRFELLLCGEGTTDPEFKSWAEKIAGDKASSITFLGVRSDLLEILPSCDLFVLSSKFEALPISIIEAFMAGLPVIASNVGGVSELVSCHEGALFQTGSDTELVSLIEGFWDYQSRLSAGAAARKKYVEKFHVSGMACAIRDKYFEILIL